MVETMLFLSIGSHCFLFLFWLLKSLVPTVISSLIHRASDRPKLNVPSPSHHDTTPSSQKLKLKPTHCSNPPQDTTRLIHPPSPSFKSDRNKLDSIKHDSVFEQRRTSFGFQSFRSIENKSRQAQISPNVELKSPNKLSLGDRWASNVKQSSSFKSPPRPGEVKKSASFRSTHSLSKGASPSSIPYMQGQSRIDYVTPERSNANGSRLMPCGTPQTVPVQCPGKTGFQPEKPNSLNLQGPWSNAQLNLVDQNISNKFHQMPKENQQAFSTSLSYSPVKKRVDSSQTSATVSPSESKNSSNQSSPIESSSNTMAANEPNTATNNSVPTQQTANFSPDQMNSIKSPREVPSQTSHLKSPPCDKAALDSTKEKRARPISFDLSQVTPPYLMTSSTSPMSMSGMIINKVSPMSPSEPNPMVHYSAGIVSGSPRSKLKQSQEVSIPSDLSSTKRVSKIPSRNSTTPPAICSPSQEHLQKTTLSSPLGNTSPAEINLSHVPENAVRSTSPLALENSVSKVSPTSVNTSISNGSPAPVSPLSPSPRSDSLNILRNYPEPVSKVSYTSPSRRYSSPTIPQDATRR